MRTLSSLVDRRMPFGWVTGRTKNGGSVCLGPSRGSLGMCLGPKGLGERNKQVNRLDVAESKKGSRKMFSLPMSGG